MNSVPKENNIQDNYKFLLIILQKVIHLLFILNIAIKKDKKTN